MILNNQELRNKAVVEWASFVKNNPHIWEKDHTNFINSQFDMAYKAHRKILKMPNGMNKIVRLFGIKNSSILKKLEKGTYFSKKN